MTTVVAKRDKNGRVLTNINEHFPSDSLNLIHKHANQQNGVSTYCNNIMKRLPMNIIVSNTVYREKTPAFKFSPNINLEDIDLSGCDHIFDKDCRPKAEIVAGIRNSLKTNNRKANTKSVHSSQEIRSNKHLSHVSRVKSYKAETLVRHLEFKENDNLAEFLDLDENEPITSSAYEYTSLELKGQHEEITSKDYIGETVVESNGLEVINICRYNKTLEYSTKSMIWKKQKITANLNRK